ncbi:hypothetical protein BGZ96_003317 [Linnemannia gamsii]|uniref:Protein kinase domain-containing protein n=1 Tax=Linnemannia gamsii TaxID=64522 RepID=A0ABQ7KHX0_9FUNG|nr:hypothetical protein BGZ96_003317 [Linnemannia gamsii]
MERISSTGSTKRPSSIHSGSGYIPTSPVSSLPPPSLLHDDVFSNNPEDYDIRLPIGYGSSAVVYNAYYKPLNRRVAIKVIDLDMFERNQIDELRRETQVMALCKHPNVLRVNGAFVTDSKLYIVTPYLSAGSCLDIMKTAYPEGFDEISIATILKQALQGLDYLHKNGHIHRDVKAGNLLVDDDGSVLLGDFGVSSSLMENGDRRGQRKTFVGTPCWMAPEVMEQAGYDYKADIWSFGITAIELATGHAPFAKYPPIKVLMLTLSNDPPTLDRESTRHRYSKLLKEMIDCCLQKDANRRPSAEKLLNHSFFKQAKKKAHLVTGLLHNLPPLEQRPPKKAPPKANIPEKGVSWDFGADDQPDEPVRRPRTVTFERPDRPVSNTTTETLVSGTLISESRPLDNMPEDDSQQQIGTPASIHSGDKPVKKSRFVVEDSSSAVSSPPTSNHGVDSNFSPSGMTSPSLSHSVVSPSPILASQNLHGLGVSSNGSEPISTPEVRKGRFSVKDTTLSISSPTPMNMKAAGGESLMSPSRSLSSSPVEGIPDGVHIGAPLEHGPSERKSRFEVHHSHAGALTPTNGTGLNSPVLSATQILSREPSQSRMAGDLGLSRDSSATRVSRFSVEPSQSPQETGPANAIALGAGTPNTSQSKRSRFQVSNVEGRPGDIATDVGGSGHSTPNTSPSASLLRGQVDIMEGQGTPAVYAHLETLYRQNEQQRVILTELFAGLGMKAGGSIPSATKSQLSYIEGQSTSVAPSSVGGQGQVTMERQLQTTIRENESLRRENEALKRELDRLRRGGL